MIECVTISIMLFISLKLVKIKQLVSAQGLDTGFLGLLSPVTGIEGENPVDRPGLQAKEPGFLPWVQAVMMYFCQCFASLGDPCAIGVKCSRVSVK